MTQAKYLLIINHVVANIISSVEFLRKSEKFQDLRLLVITNRNDFEVKYNKYLPELEVIHCDFDDTDNLKLSLKPYTDKIAGIICRGDRHIQYLRKVVPVLPDSLLVASSLALEKSTNKLLMRQSFTKNYPEITPKAMLANDSSNKSLGLIKKDIGYPVVLKPANLFSSLLITICSNRSELKQALEGIFAQIDGLYRQRDIHEQPLVIAEEYLEGDFYSIDAYVMQYGDVYFCPPVAYIPAKQLGIDDFFLYKRFIPTKLTVSEIADGNEAVRKALISVGLEHSSAHVELVLTKNGWKIIEIGPRLGRFRHMMYELGYGINHSLNDIKIHLGLEPEIPKDLINYCSAYSIYATKEGILKKINGIAELNTIKEIKSLKIYAKPGDEVKFAKNGGHAITEFVLSSKNAERFSELTSMIEERVHAEID